VVEVMQRMRPAALLLFFLAASCLSGQEQQPREAPRRLMLGVTQAGAIGLTEEELTIVSRSMLLALQEIRADLILVEPSRRPADPSDGGMSRLAEGSGADCWMLVEISGSRTEPALRVHSRDVLSGSTVIDKTIRRQAGEGLSVLALPYERWEDISALLAGAYPPRDATDLPSRDPGSAVLTVRALPGTVLTFSGGTKATVGPDGKAEASLAVPAAYQLQAALRGSSTVKESLYIQADRELAVAQARVPRFAIDASALMSWPGLAVSFFPLPERVFVRAGLTTYLVGLAFRPEALFFSDPLTNLDILVGTYVNPAYSPVRAYAGVGGFLRFVHAAGLPLHLDPLSPAGVQAALGLETSIGASARFFAEYEPMLYATQTPELMRSTQRSGAGWAFFSRAALQLLSFRIGIRWLR
jgi:hypothetical protein